MSNHLAVATVTSTLQRVLQQAIQISVDGASVTTTRPDGGGGVPETGVNLYLYHLKRNGAFSNGDHPGRQRRGEIGKQNQLSIDLYYLISFYGNEAEMEPHRLLGTTLQVLADQRTLDPPLIRETINDPSFSLLADSDLAEQVEQIRMEFMPISTDELSKVWSVFLQTPYALSVVYKVTVIVIQGHLPGQRALPVRDRRLGITPLSKQPILDSVYAESSKYDPILVSSSLHLKGRFLQAPSVTVRLGAVDIPPSQISDTDVIVSLNRVPILGLKAGVQGVQVIHHPDRNASTHQRMAAIGGRRGQRSRNATSAGVSPNGGPHNRTTNGTTNGTTNHMPQTLTQPSVRASALNKTIESNVIPFVLRPSIETVALSDVDGIDDDPRSGQLHITTDVVLGAGQRIVVTLNDRALINPDDYVFDPLDVPTDSHTVIVPFKDIKPGQYLVRIQVDGAESVLQIDQNPRSETFEHYIGPEVDIA